MSNLKEQTSNPGNLELEALFDINLSAGELISRFIEIAMRKERERYLVKNEEDKGNGYYERELAVAGSPQSLTVPRTRSRGFRPSLLPDPWKRMTPNPSSKASWRILGVGAD